MIFDTLQVTTMTTILFLAVYLVFQHARYNVIVRIAIGKTVRHNKVKYIAGIKTFDFR